MVSKKCGLENQSLLRRLYSFYHWFWMSEFIHWNIYFRDLLIENLKTDVNSLDTLEGLNLGKLLILPQSFGWKYNFCGFNLKRFVLRFVRLNPKMPCLQIIFFFFQIFVGILIIGRLGQGKKIFFQNQFNFQNFENFPL